MSKPEPRTPEDTPGPPAIYAPHSDRRKREASGGGSGVFPALTIRDSALPWVVKIALASLLQLMFSAVFGIKLSSAPFRFFGSSDEVGLKMGLPWLLRGLCP
ncbi:hypothetical protein LEMLEM_LOCUS4161 [Lemmus lemmus]